MLESRHKVRLVQLQRERYRLVLSTHPALPYTVSITHSFYIIYFFGVVYVFRWSKW